MLFRSGAAGNVTAGKYNNGDKANRMILRDRMHKGMVEAWKKTSRISVPATGWTWRVEPVLLPPRTEATFSEAISIRDLNDEKKIKARRNNAAFQLAWLKRRDTPIEITALAFGKSLAVVHLPGEPFIEFQLATQKLRPDATVCVAGYGDGGPGYIPTADAYTQEGYEPTVALASPDAEAIVLKAIAKVLDADFSKLKPQ